MTATTTATHMIEIMMPNIDNSNQSGNNDNDNNNQCNNQQNNFSNNDNNDSIINDDNDLDHNNDAKMMKNLFTSQVLNDLKFGEQKNDSKIYDNDNDNSIENIDNGQPDQDNETIKVLESYKDYNINNIDSHNIILTSSTLMKSSTTTASTTNNDQSMNYTIMIDDLFIRKLLHQICPQTFDETWLERFKQQYLQSFDENKCSSHDREILDQILSSNLLTNVDEIFVYWPIVRNNNRNDNDTKIRIDSTLLSSLSSPTWLQYRDAMTYLYHFCELLMSIEAKFQHNEQKDMCQQLAREIRSYLYWITNDKRFNICDDNLRNEESISPSSSSSLSLPVINNEINDHQSITGVDDKNNKNSYQNELFYSILQHLLRILFEILMQLKQQQQNELDVGHSNRDDLIINDHLRFFQIFSKLFERSKSLTNDQQSLYIQWMKKLNTLLMLLMKYGTNNRNQNNNNNNNKINNNNTHQSKNQFIENKMIASSSTLSQDHESIMLNIESNNNNNDINHENNIINANGNNNDECSAIASSSIALIPSSNEISIVSDQQINSTTIKYFENQSNQSPTSNCFISKINPLLSVESSSIQPQQMKKLNSNFTNQSSSDCSLKMAIINNGSGSQTNTNSSTHVERNTSSSAASVSSGPSSGVGSLCDSYSRCIGNNGNAGLGMSEPNSNLLFNSNTSPASQSSLSPNKFLPVGSVSSSSASMTPSPAQFSTTSIVGNNESVVNDENTLSMIFKMNQCRLIDDIAEGMPKLITPPPSSNNNDKFKESTNNSNQFGFDFNSLNSANRNLNFQQPQQQSIDESSNFGFINNSTTNIDDIQNGTTASATNGDNNNNFFNDFNITSLFSSFDDNVSSIESGTVITDHHFTNSSPTMQNLVNQHQTASMLKPYPENDANIQLQNQCFTVTMMDGNEQHQPQQQQQQQLNRFNNVTKFPLSQSAAINKQMPMMSKYVSQQQQQILSNPSNIMNSQQQQTPPQLLHSSDISSSDQLQTQEQFCERQTLYRLIISQLLFDGHRNIACHIANAEHIKCDSFLIGPSQELHKLVTFAKAKKKEDILISKPIQMSVTNNTNNPCYSSNGRSTTNVSGGTFYDMVDSNNSSTQNSPQSMLVGRTSLQQHSASSHPLRTDDSNPYAKNIFGDPSSSSAAANTLAGFGSSFASRNGANSLTTSPSIGSHRPQSQCASASILDSYTELNSSATDLYSPTSGTLDYFSANRNSDISAASMFGKSNDLNQRLSINRANGSASVAGSNDLVLTEACLKNLNQLAKLNSGPNNAALNHPSLMFGRSVSAMAAMSPLGNGNGSTSSPVVTASNNSLSRSPLSMKSPTGQISASHTTGQGKSHLIMQIVHKFGSLGQLKSQFSSPHGFCLGMNDEIIIADTNNHRICIYEKNGVCKQMFGNPGKDEGQLWYPRKIAMIPPNFVRSNANSPYYVICDRGMERSRMQIFTRTGSFVRKIPIRYIDIVAGIAINSRGHIVVVDSVSPTIYVITIENGTLIKWHDCGNYMCEPSDVAIYDDDYYICDFKGHCVVVINSNGDFIRKIGMEGLTSFPNGIDISPIGDIFVGDSHGNKFHVVVFNRDGRLLAEYECPYCKVSRCCGLKLTKDNNIVTLAKNNHHVLVLNPNFHQQQIQQQQQQQQQQQSPSQPQST